MKAVSGESNRCCSLNVSTSTYFFQTPIFDTDRNGLIIISYMNVRKLPANELGWSTNSTKSYESKIDRSRLQGGAPRDRRFDEWRKVRGEGRRRDTSSSTGGKKIKTRTRLGYNLKADVRGQRREIIAPRREQGAAEVA